MREVYFWPLADNVLALLDVCLLPELLPKQSVLRSLWRERPERGVGARIGR